MIDSTAVEMAKRTDLIALAKQQVELRRESASEWSGPCPVCGGSDRLHVKATGFFCRQCHPEFGDVIEYMCWTRNIKFTEAVQMLTGQVATTVKPKIQPATKAPAVPQQSPAWHAKALELVTAAQGRLEEGMPYLEGRSIDFSTALAFGLGYRFDAPLPGTWDAAKRAYSYQPQPAIVIPWYRAGKLAAVRYRFLASHTYTDVEGRERTAKLTSVPGSDFAGLMYGGHMLPAFVTMPLPESGKCAERLRTLVIIEGELNAMSVWQVVYGWRWDVLSLGSESQKLPDGGRILAERYGRTIVWMDKAQIAQSIMTMIPGAVAVNSPVIEGKKIDANDMLRSGELAQFLIDVRCTKSSEAEKEMLNHWLQEIL